ncbi:hypothetical protein [Sinorhizobium medicae]
MGLPNSYSIDLPIRCLDLLNLALPVVERDGQTAERHRGPLTTTLTLALATPMLVIPIERIQKYLGYENEGYADDRKISEYLAQRLQQAVNEKKLKDYTEFADFDWAFAQTNDLFNSARGLPNSLAENLNTQEAAGAAREMPVAQFLACLRNALSHGGILYLNDDGHSTHGQASKLCFVSARMSYPRPICMQAAARCPKQEPQLTGLRLLRISETGFRRFLATWATWLREADLADLASQ